MKLRVKGDYVMFHCVACKHAHVVPFQDTTGHGKTCWQLNGETITPSLKIFTPADAELKLPELIICHLNVTNGMLQYHSDSAHSLRGQTIPMADWES